MDLSQFDIVQAATVSIINPQTMEPLFDEGGRPITMQVAGVDSARFRERQYALAESRAQKGERPTGAELDADRLDTLAFCLMGWDGITLDGEPLPYSQEAARALLERLPWLAHQVDLAVVDRALHFKAVQPEAAPAEKPSKAKGRSRAAA